MLRRIHHLPIVMAISCATMLPAFTCSGQEQNVEQRIAEVQKKIHALVNEGEELKQRGHPKEAQSSFARAEAMQAELNAWIERLRRQGAERRAQQKNQERDGGHYINALEHLEHAMGILKENGNGELAMQLNNVANQIRERVQRYQPDREQPRERENSEREFVKRQIEALHMALNVLREAERGDAAELMHRAIRAREVGLEGRRDEEAQMIRERSPSADQIRRMMGLAVELYQEYNAPDRAEHLAHAMRELFPQRREQDRARQGERAYEQDRREHEREVERHRPAPGREDREHLAHQIEVMRIAMHAILEAGREDTAELLEHAIHARELMLEGVRNEEARHVIESAPKLGEMVEILSWASHLWEEYGNEDKAHIVGELAEQMEQEWHARREREHDRDFERERHRENDEAAHARAEQMEEIERRLAELQEELEHTLAQLRELREDR